MPDAAIIEPYRTCSLDEGLASTELFTPRTLQSMKNFIKRLSPVIYRHEAMRIHRTCLELPCENLNEPIKDYRTLNGDGLISVCMKVKDQAHRHEIAVYNHVTEELKHVGSIPRHHFNMSHDQFVFNMDDPKFVEGVIGAITYDGKFVAIFAHSQSLRVVSVFDIANAVCFFEKNLSQSKFFKDCQPTGIALLPDGPSTSQFNIAVLSYNMEIRVWNTGDCLGKIVKLEDARSSFGLGYNIINHRESFLRYSPDGRYLCVLAYVESRYLCVVLDAITLQALFKMPYNFTYGQLCCIFPCFTVCNSQFVMFTPQDEKYYEIENYQLHFYEIPQKLQCLKDLCRLSILRAVDRSNLSNLPLSQNLLLFLTGSDCTVSISEKTDNKCCLM